MSTILVIAEHRQGELRESTFESLGAALTLGTEQVVTALLGDNPRPLAAQLEGRTPTLHLLGHPELANYEAELYVEALADLIGSLQPSLVLTGHTSQGMDLAPALAGKLGAPLVTDCTAFALNGGTLTVERAPYGGKLTESLTLKPATTTLLTLQGGAFAQASTEYTTTTHERTLDGVTRRGARRFLQFIEGAAADVDITAAEILISVGRGIGSEENIALAQALAGAVGGVVSCSRPVADAGWLPQTRQVGTSGQTVRPKLYIALGISGAFQHLAGMRTSETILAVNKDPRAPIFNVASYGIVGDVLEVLPALTAQLRG